MKNKQEATMAFEGLSEKLQAFTKKLRGKARINETELTEMLREVILKKRYAKCAWHY